MLDGFGVFGVEVTVAQVLADHRSILGLHQSVIVAVPRGHTVISRSYRVPSIPRPPRNKRGSENLCGRSAQDDTSH